MFKSNKPHFISTRNARLIRPWITEQNNSQLLLYWVHFLTHFKINGSTCFSSSFCLRHNWRQKKLLGFKFFTSQLYRKKCLKFLRTRKKQFKTEISLNLSVLWLSLAIVACYLNYLDTGVLAQPFWTLANISSLFSVVRFWTKRTNMATKWSSRIWRNTQHSKKTKHSLYNDNFVASGLQRTNEKIGKIVTLYHRELSKRRPSLGTFGTQSVFHWLTWCKQ